MCIPEQIRRISLSFDNYQVARISPEQLGIIDNKFPAKPMQRCAACAGSVLAGNDPVGHGRFG